MVIFFVSAITRGAIVKLQNVFLSALFAAYEQ